MGQRLVAFTVAVTLGIPIPALGAQDGLGATSRKMLAFFQDHGKQSVDAFLRQLRPDPIDPVSRARVIDSLPREGEIAPSAKDRTKLMAAERILDYSARRGAIEIKVVTMDQPFVGLYLRSVILISGQALRLLNPEELAALVAHEVGHDYDFAAYETALQQRDTARMRELELKSDALAVLALQQVGISPDRLIDAIRKVMRDSGQGESSGAIISTAGSVSTTDRYVPLPERIGFIRAVAGLRWRASPTAVATTGIAPQP